MPRLSHLQVIDSLSYIWGDDVHKAKTQAERCDFGAFLV